MATYSNHPATAKSSESDILKDSEAGADDYITKPFQLTLLLAKIRSLLKNKEKLLRNYSNIIAFEMQKPNINYCGQGVLTTSYQLCI